jgi:hypothetical protein
LFPGITLLDPNSFDRAAKRRVNKPRRPVLFAGHPSGLMLKVSLDRRPAKFEIEGDINQRRNHYNLFNQCRRISRYEVVKQVRRIEPEKEKLRNLPNAVGDFPTI